MARLLGFNDWNALESFVSVDQRQAMDKNENGYVCMKSLPPSQPAYLFVGVDDQSSRPTGD